MIRLKSASRSGSLADGQPIKNNYTEKHTQVNKHIALSKHVCWLTDTYLPRTTPGSVRTGAPSFPNIWRWQTPGRISVISVRPWAVRVFKRFISSRGLDTSDLKRIRHGGGVIFEIKMYIRREATAFSSVASRAFCPFSFSSYDQSDSIKWSHTYWIRCPILWLTAC